MNKFSLRTTEVCHKYRILAKPDEYLVVRVTKYNSGDLVPSIPSFSLWSLPQPGNMVKLNILAGGNVAFIASYLFNSIDRTLTLVKKNPSGENTAWIERSAVNPSIL
jgi:hypothetical protein